MLQIFHQVLVEDRKDNPGKTYTYDNLGDLIQTARGPNGSPIEEIIIEDESMMTPEQFKQHEALLDRLEAEREAALNRRHEELREGQRKLLLALSQAKSQHLGQFLATSGKKSEQDAGLLGKIKANWEALVLIGVILLAGAGGPIYLNHSITNAVFPLTQTLNGPSGHPEQGLVMDVRSMTGYIDANGNKTEGKLDLINHKLDKLLDAKDDSKKSTP